MLPSTGRRSRTLGSDDDSEESRAGTPASTAPNDSKRARRSLADDRTPSRNGTPVGSTLNLIPRPRTQLRSTSVDEDAKFKFKPKYQPGAIVRVKLTNFVTYTSAEFKPGPSLNMVIGPNGTGKSTLVCAICLGLGWGTQHLGRAKDASEYVKHGCAEATIEIELQRIMEGVGATKRNPIFVRKIKRDGGKSTFTVNREVVSQKFAVEFARSMSIQIDNLCQFLPQDKVVEFAAMTPLELLRSTQQAAAPPEMLRWHEDLKKLRAHQRTVFLEKKSDQEELVNLTNRQEMNRVDVDRMKEKLATQKRLGWLEKCRPIPKYGEAKRKTIEAKARQKQLSAELTKLKDELAPTLKRVNAKERYLKQVQVLRQQREKDVVDTEMQCDKIEANLTKVEDKINDCDVRIDAEKRSRLPKRDEALRVQREINKLKSQMEEIPEEFDSRLMNEQIQAKVERKRELEQQNGERRGKVTSLKTQGEDRNKAITDLKKKLADLNTEEGQQQSKLQTVAPETHRAWQWIQSHKDEFEKEVFGPPMVSCSLKDPRMADAIESFFQENDTKTITVQTLNDFNLLQRKLMREMRLHDISLRVCSDSSLDQFRPPMSNERLQELGLESWAIDQLNGPPTVLAMLCMEKFLHQNAISTRDISDDQYNRIVAAGMRSFVAGKTSYTVTRRAEYGSAGVGSKTRAVRDAKVWTNLPIDANTKARYERQIAEIGHENSEIKTQFDELRAEGEIHKIEHAELVQQIDALKEKKDQKQKALIAFRALPAKLAQQEEKLAAVQESMVGVKERMAVILKEKDEYLLQKSQGTIQFAAAVGILREKTEALLEADLFLLEAQSDVVNLRARNQGIRDMLDTKQKETNEAEAEREREIAIARSIMGELKKLSAEAKRLHEEEDEDGLMTLVGEISDNKTTIEDLEAEIDSLKGRLELIQGFSGNIIKEFEDRDERIEKLRGRVGEAKQKLEDTSHAIREIREKWEPKLEELVARISDKFGESFARIGCAGEVVIFKATAADNDEDENSIEGEAGNGLDFANWAIHISVRFRENEPLSLLDAHRQSGGERAVSTIFYLMALQSLSRAPFRVVDEINQGMDPRNERMVHGRMVDIATPKDGDETSSSQYFLITPKLLSGLKYRRGMTVLCIVSGENMPAAIRDGEEGKEVEVRDGEGNIEVKKLWNVDFSRFIKRARELGLKDQMGGVGLGGRRVDSGVGLGSSFTSTPVDEEEGGVREMGRRSVTVQA